MKLIKVTLLLLTFGILFASAHDAEAQPRKRKIQRVQAKKYLKRTNRVIFAAKAAVAKNKNYTGDLSKAVRHQRVAKRMYTRGRLRRAVAHSHAARLRATRAIKANRGKAPVESQFTAEENNLYDGSEISEQSLEQELNTELPEEITEEDLINSDLGIDITD